MREIARDLREKDRQKLLTLRAQIRALVEPRKQAMKDAVLSCRSERVKLKERAKAARLALREALAAEKVAARSTCSARKQEIRKSDLTERQKARQKIAAEKALQAEIRSVDQRLKKKISRRTSTEARSESDDEVRSNLPPDLLPLFERVRKTIRASSRMSRTESFLHFAEEHPGEVLAAINEEAEKQLRHDLVRLRREEAALTKTLRKASYQPTRAELAAIPF